MKDYVKCLGIYFPDVSVVCFGDSRIYDNLQVEGDEPLPPQEVLDAMMLTHTKETKVLELSDNCRKEIIGGFTSTALDGVVHMYDAQREDQLNLVGSVSSIAPDAQYPSGTAMPYAVRPVVDGLVQSKRYKYHTFYQLRQVMQDGTMFKLMRLQKFNEKRDYVNYLCSTIEEVEAVTWTSEDTV